MRNEMVAAVVRRLAEYPDFRIELADDPQRALEAHGFELEADDLHVVTGLARRLQRADPAAVSREISGIASQLGISLGEE